jgi:sigma-B regulation protein RsbU (phosphoserine phosphatase)
MDQPLFSMIARSLREQRGNLLEWVKSASSTEKAVRLGKNSEDALREHLRVLDDAVEKADSAELGRCTVCHDHVESHWLEVDYTTCICLSHLTGEERSRLEAELELSQKVQRALLPQVLPDIEGLRLGAYIQPASIVGGDYFDFLTFGDGNPAMVIADVMGKGVPASMLVANLQAYLRVLVPESESPEQVLARLNRLFCHNIQLTKFVTLVLIKVLPGSHGLEYANAGHNPPLFLPKGAKTVDEAITLLPTGAAIGLVEHATFTSRRIPLAEGDSLVLYTDGVVEARGADEEQFGEHRLIHYALRNLTRSPEEMIRGLKEELNLFSRGGAFADDTTILVARRT